MSTDSKQSSPYSLAGLFSMPATEVPFLHGLRAISILMVLAFHLLYPLTKYMSMDSFVALAKGNPLAGLSLQGHFGVDIFFVLSGFLIASSFFAEMDGKTPRLVARFFVKRAFRLLPAYYAVLVIAYLAFPNHCQSILYNLFYVNNYIPTSQACVFWSWSLAIEEQFYLVFPLLAYLLFRLPNRHVVFLSLLGFAGAINIGYLAGVGAFESNWDFADRFYQPTQFRFGALVLGVYAAYIQRYNAREVRALLSVAWIRRTAGCLAFLCFAVPVFVPSNAVMQVFDQYDNVLAITYEGLYRYIFSTSIFLSILLLQNDTFPRARGLLSHRFYYPLSRLSYVLYLVHFLIIQEVYAWGYQDLNSLGVLIPVSLGLTVIATVALYVTVEAPAMRLRSVLVRRYFPR